MGRRNRHRGTRGTHHWAATFVALLVVALLGCTSSEAPGSGPASGKKRIAVIPKGTTHNFWKSVHAGATQAGEELGVEIIWKGPLKENDRAQQIQVVEQFVTEGVDGIVIAPLDDNALVRPLRAAMDKGIPVVIIDSALNGDAGKDFVCFASTDNHKGGLLGGERLAQLLGGKGKVVLLRYQVGSASTDKREAGFLEALAKHPGIELISDNQYAGATMGEALQKSEEIIDKLKAADGVFCPNESSTNGMLVALRKHNLVGTLKFVGFDASPELIAGLEKKEIDALVVQNPTKMGYEGVKNMMSHLGEKNIPARIDTGVAVVDAANLKTAEIQALLSPR